MGADGWLCLANGRISPLFQRSHDGPRVYVGHQSGLLRLNLRPRQKVEVPVRFSSSGGAAVRT